MKIIKLLCIALTLAIVSSGPIDLEYQVDPFNSFAQVKNITLIVAKNKETYR